MKVMVVFGTRPEAIKMCPLVLELKKRSEIETIVCTTGQHKEMLDQVMEVFHVTENYNLSIMEEKQTLSMITSKVLLGIDEILKTEKPDIMLVHGDTTTSFAASLSAFYHQISVGHVEAGLRTYDLYSPFPEEFNRQAVDIVSDLYFAPTELAKKQLLREGKSEKNIIVTGNTVIDALSTTIKKEYYHEELEWAKGSKLILFTAHRRENIGQPMQNIFHALCKIVNENKNVKVIYPIHKNPKVREIADGILGNQERIHMIEPLDVFDFHNFIARSYMVMTDSGGIQEEAPSLGKPVLVLRDTTERPEGVAAGTLKLTGTQEDTIYRIATQLLNNKEMYNKMSIASNPYGDGHASKRIVEYLLQSIS